MPTTPHQIQQEFHGYVYFEDADWWHNFSITKKCAHAIQEFRRAVFALMPHYEHEVQVYEETLYQVWERSEHVVDHMQWHAKRDIALMVALAELYDECVDQITPVNFKTGRIHNYLNIKAESIHSLLSTMHNIRC